MAQFENIGSVAAQDVSVTHQLDADLDWSTFQLGAFGFGPIDVAVPAGLTQYRTTVAYQNVDGSPLNVVVTLDFNVQTGLLTATFTSLDPMTGQWPEGVFDGFLPPNDATHVGEGHVQYTVLPKPGLSTGTTVSQQASIVFGINDPIATNTHSNTIDAGPPTSSVLPLPPSQTTPSFLVTWSGQDDAGGSDIATYTIYVSDNGGPYAPWLVDTTLTSDTYPGQDKHAYKFYSLATDNVGHRQPAPGTPASTVVGSIWHNYAKPWDVDGLNGVQPVDVLTVINYINSHPGVTALPAPPAVGPPYYDVDANDLITPADVLAVINYINSHPVGSGEGEAAFELVLPPIESPAAAWPISPGGGAPSADGDANGAATARQFSSVVVRDSSLDRPLLREAAAKSRPSAAQRRMRADQIWDDWDAQLDSLNEILLDLAASQPG